MTKKTSETGLINKLQIEKKPTPTGWNTIRVVVLSVTLVIIFLVVGLGIGFLIGKHIYSEHTQKENDRYKHHKKILDSMKADHMKTNLEYLTELPHPPGGNEVKKIGDYLATNWKKEGFDKIETFKYNVYLSYPKAPAEISIWDGSSLKKKFVIGNEPTYYDSERKGKVLVPFNAFSPSKVVTAGLVYGNYGRKKDFKKLKDVGIDVRGKIVILRYGKASRTSKLYSAEAWGAIGVIIFTDPYDHTYPGEEYPNGWMLNRYGVQRGTTNRIPGDALSIGYPAKDCYFRKHQSKYSGNPTIPSQPISYGTAYDILSAMNNHSIPLPGGFQGGLNFTYALSSENGMEFTLNVSAQFLTRPTYTVCGTLYGNEEPDRYIMIGNHRDSWTYGAADPSSGTAAMMEITRTLGSYKKKTGWRPKRSIMACSWAAEEAGLLGSTEWADENHRFLMENVVAYLNVDMAVEGNFTVRLKALDFLSDGIFKTAKNIPAPDTPSRSLYEDWLIKSAILKNETVDKPVYSTPSSGSDYKAIWHSYGTTTVDFRYYYSKINFPRLPNNPQYHTLYESFDWMSRFIDPDFIHHLAIGRLWGGYALELADARILPFDLIAYTKQIEYYLHKFNNTYNEMLFEHDITLSFAQERLEALIMKAERFHKWIAQLDEERKRALVLRRINDKMMNFERNFLVTGIATNPVVKHVVYATTLNKLHSTKFPGISEAIYFASKNATNDWDDVRKQITLVVWCFDTANRSLDIEE